MPDFEEIESLFSKLIEASSSILSKAECCEIQEFIDAGEYGLGLQTAVAILVEEKKSATTEMITIMSDLATLMHLEPKTILKKIIGVIP